MELKDQVVLITGGAGGLGHAMCHRFAAAGARLVVGYRSSAAAAETLAGELKGGGHSARPAPVEDSHRLAELAAEIAAEHGRLDILVNNAGITRFVAHDDLDGLDDELIDDIFRTNWRGAFACVRAMRPLLEAQGGGLVINISSIAGVTAMGSNIAYCASKAAMNTLTMSLARALAPRIRVVSLSPGLAETDFVTGLDQAWWDEQSRRTPLRRLASPEDVARAALAIATDLKFSNGCIIPVDGGRPLT
ncbi:MAG: SDR family oxidoreductase [Alphaproteobacteria bacterium]|jgi:3-oxoacyl-[acyl-carrier protein] reductase|nr:SDR family oxidoreductase [Alphaproteobacteria bacterium]MDP6589261.1 SDR family oxidoreductase [Alphaproteobacteria bacterium]MDP6818207.1 SDR family oxidoreductase [Alphaproteobacteria bacterium]